MFVGAHPDDDTLAVSRSVALLADDPPFRFSLVLATDGDAGEVAPGCRDTAGGARLPAA